MASAQVSSTRSSWTLDGRGVLFILVLFFGSVFGVNFYFAARAISTYTGEVANEPYRKGLAYNDRIAAGDKQAGLGWADAVTINREGAVSLRVEGRNGKAIDGLAVTGSIGRGATDREDHPLRFAATADGKYAAQTAALAPGSWIVTIKAKRYGGDADPIYQIRRRLWLTP
jgi:nitrogen fixation protein FixH